MKIFVDSSLPVEHTKGNRVENDLLEYLLSYNFDLIINPIVFSEIMFHFLMIHGEKSGLALKKSRSIGKVITENDPLLLLKYFKSVNPSSNLQTEALRLMRRYNLLPNDALILAHCLDEPFEYLASYDSDFIIPCREEGITLIDSITSFKKIFEMED